MKRIWLLLLAMLLCVGMAAADLPEQLLEIDDAAFEGDEALTGVMYLPETVQRVGAKAFAGTSLHGLVVPEGCQSLAADVLLNGKAAYVTLNGAGTSLTGSSLADVSFVFAPEGSMAADMAGFYASETLVMEEGIFFSLTQEEAIPLCAAFPMEEGEIRLPKTVDELPLVSLDVLTLKGCVDGTVSVPSYLTIPEGLNVTTYDAMTLTAPVPNVTECTAGDAVTWTTEIAGAYGDVSYIWYFDTDGVVSSLITAVPTVTWSTRTQGRCVASVKAIDALGDRASAKGAAITVGEPIPVYRALIIGNTYPEASDPLPGCDTDARAMSSMLSSMTGTDYDVTVRLNLSASGIQSAIGSTFADARACDVSLFYFSGHGTSYGSLVGTGNTAVSVSTLRGLLDEVPGTKIVIIDACYSGQMIGKSEGSLNPASFTSAFVSGFSTFTKANDLANNGYVVMTACSMDQYSQSLSDGVISFGVFTYSLCYGCGYDEWDQVALGRMPADGNGDGQITLGEAYAGALNRIEWLRSIVPPSIVLDQAAQYYGDTTFVLWGQ